MMKTLFAKIKKDPTSGSSIHLKNLICQLQQYMKDGVDRNTLYKGLLEVQQVFPLFKVLEHFIEAFRKAPSQTDIPAFIMAYQKQWSAINEQVASNALNYLNLDRKTLLLHSNSGAIQAICQLAKAQGQNFKIIQTESRPAHEGRQQALYLANSGIKVTMVADTAITREFPPWDMAIVGADAIFQDAFINKIGTYGIGLACKELQRPLFLLADSRKLARQKVSPELKEARKPADELWPGAPSLIEVSNYYFEKTPLHLIQKCITEEALL
ncbi:hypothetical protein AAG747_17215 [Rapidithrix thailandica]|uniref:Translation initiation factor eIF-2B subunit delta n=1 Tax=Rapidithrix thailandica TaxID=413964 RepID=A0AAW9SG41_9BACT